MDQPRCPRLGERIAMQAQQPNAAQSSPRPVNNSTLSSFAKRSIPLPESHLPSSLPAGFVDGVRGGSSCTDVAAAAPPDPPNPCPASDPEAPVRAAPAAALPPAVAGSTLAGSSVSSTGSNTGGNAFETSTADSHGGSGAARAGAQPGRSGPHRAPWLLPRPVFLPLAASANGSFLPYLPRGTLRCLLPPPLLPPPPHLLPSLPCGCPYASDCGAGGCGGGYCCDGSCALCCCDVEPPPPGRMLMVECRPRGPHLQPEPQPQPQPHPSLHPDLIPGPPPLLPTPPPLPLLVPHHPFPPAPHILAASGATLPLGPIPPPYRAIRHLRYTPYARPQYPPSRQQPLASPPPSRQPPLPQQQPPLPPQQPLASPPLPPQPPPLPTAPVTATAPASPPVSPLAAAAAALPNRPGQVPARAPPTAIRLGWAMMGLACAAGAPPPPPPPLSRLPPPPPELRMLVRRRPPPPEQQQQQQQQREAPPGYQLCGSGPADAAAWGALRHSDPGAAFPPADPLALWEPRLAAGSGRMLAGRAGAGAAGCGDRTCDV